MNTQNLMREHRIDLIAKACEGIWFHLEDSISPYTFADWTFSERIQMATSQREGYINDWYPEAAEAMDQLMESMDHSEFIKIIADRIDNQYAEEDAMIQGIADTYYTEEDNYWEH